MNAATVGSGKQYPIRYVVSSAAVTVVSLGLCVAHRLLTNSSKTAARIADYIAGSVLWAGTVSVKVGIAVSALPPVLRIVGKSRSATMIINGLLTGCTECVGTLLLAMTPYGRRMSREGVVAFGLGFGCFEAVALAVPLFVLSAYSAAGEAVEPALENDIDSLLSDSSRPFSFAWERAVAVSVHALSSYWIFASVHSSSPRLFAFGFALKSLVDAVPTEPDVISPEALQAVYGVFGVGSALGLLAILRRPSSVK